jgi:hypothetical protein
MSRTKWENLILESGGKNLITHIGAVFVSHFSKMVYNV